MPKILQLPCFFFFELFNGAQTYGIIPFSKPRLTGCLMSDFF